MLSCRSSCKVRTRKKSIHPRSPNPETCSSSLLNEQMPFCLKTRYRSTQPMLSL